MTYTGDTATGWTCNFAAGTETCTLPSLASGASANPITLNCTPSSTAPVVDTATVSSVSYDPVLTNNTATTAALPVAPSTAIPALGLGALALLGAALAIAAAVILKR
jgi:hypothetical protein